jgi:hypothetical protein
MAEIIDGLRELVSPAVLSALSRQTGESESAVSRAPRSRPAITSTVAGRADDRGFVRDLLDRHHDGCGTSSARGHQRARVLANGHRHGNRSASIPQTRTGWLADLFGHNISGVTDRIARYVESPQHRQHRSLSMAAPLVLAYRAPGAARQSQRRWPRICSRPRRSTSRSSMGPCGCAGCPTGTCRSPRRTGRFRSSHSWLHSVSVD